MTNEDFVELIIREQELKVKYLQTKSDADCDAWMEVRDQLNEELARRMAERYERNTK